MDTEAQSFMHSNPPCYYVHILYLCKNNCIIFQKLPTCDEISIYNINSSENYSS